MFEEETKTFDENRADLCASHLGWWAIVKGSEIVGVFKTSNEAFKEALERFGPDAGFMLKEILPEDRVHFIPTCWRVD